MTIDRSAFDEAIVVSYLFLWYNVRLSEDL